MISIVGGLGAALLWASATLTSSRAGRLIGPTCTVAWMMLVGLLVAAPLGLASGPVPALTPSLMLWVLGSGAGGVTGMLFVYRGLRHGKVGVVAALASTEGAIAAVVSVVAGEAMTIPVAATLCAIVVGVAVVALATGEQPAAPEAAPAVAPAAPMPAPATAVPASATDPPRRLSREQYAVLYGAAGAACFGLTIYCTGKLGTWMPPLMAVLPVRVFGVIAVFVPLALTGRLRLTRRAAPMVIWIGLAEVFGNASYVVGAGESLAVAAVLASQFGAVAAVAAYLLFRERLSLIQRSGVVVIAVSVAVLTLVRA